MAPLEDEPHNGLELVVTLDLTSLDSCRQVADLHTLGGSLLKQQHRRERVTVQEPQRRQHVVLKHGLARRAQVDLDRVSLIEE